MAALEPSQQQPVHRPGILAKKISSMSLRICKTKISKSTKSNRSDSSLTIAVPPEYASCSKDSHRKRHPSKHRMFRVDWSSPSTSSSSSSSSSYSSLASSSSSSSTDAARERRSQMAIASSHVWALYMAGTPLFTRAALHSLAQQLDRPGVRTGFRNVVVEVSGLDGKRQRVPTRSGSAANSDAHPDIVLVSVRPHIDYWTVEKLTGRAAWHVHRFDPALALLPMRISHMQEARHRDASSGVIGQDGARTVGDLASNLGSNMAGTSPLPTRRLSVDEVRKVFQQQRAQWEASDACRELRAKLRMGLARQRMNSKPKNGGNPARVCKVVAFACSSMTEEREGGSARHAVQHAMVLTVRDVLEELQKSENSDNKNDNNNNNPPCKIECIAQDPAYGEADLTVLAEAGIAVVDDPYGFLAVDETTVVISVAPSVPVRQIVADIARPAAMIWSKVADPVLSPQSALIEELGGWDDPASPRVRSMVRDGYDELAFPSDQLNFGTVDGMAIYIRRSGSNGGVIPAGCGNACKGTIGLLQTIQRKLLCQPV